MIFQEKISIDTLNNHTAKRYTTYNDGTDIIVNGAKNHVYVPITNSYWLLPQEHNFINIIDVNSNSIRKININ